MTSVSAGPTLPVFPESVIRIQGVGFGARQGTIHCGILFGAPIPLDVVANGWGDESIYVYAPSIKDLQALMTQELGALAPRVVSFPINLQITRTDGASMGCTVSIFLGGPIIETVEELDLLSQDPRDFRLQGFNFGDPDYSDIYFSPVRPPWEGLYVTINGVGAFVTEAARPGDGMGFVENDPTVFLSDAFLQTVSDFPNEGAIYLNPFITDRSEAEIHFRLPWNLDLGLVSGGQVGKTTVDAFVVAFRNLVPSAPAVMKIRTEFNLL